ncbi:hypothetical protein HOLleu_03227 [Holothuria leucospilota]|uniref:Uncharacterized protein n=1 Tax=Holothuria leucospilota TaxID=206669 RepID=A0A9Q1HLT1_HOLLE|nr:hypothetical protein HOLleu_03227 [Holothuria leucospilota]
MEQNATAVDGITGQKRASNSQTKKRNGQNNNHFHKRPSSLPRKKQQRIVAQKVVAEYRKSFKDEIGTGCDSLLTQLVNRVDYLFRQPGGHVFKRRSQSNESITPKKRKTDSYGCINWQAETFPAEEHEETKKKKKKTKDLQTFYTSGQHDANIKELIDPTYISQRTMINSKDCILIDLMEQWPYLLKEAYLLDHFNILVGINLKNKVEECAKTKISRLCRFLEQEASHIQRLRQTLHSMKDAMEANGNGNGIGTLLLLCRYFDKDTEVIAIEVSTSSS